MTRARNPLFGDHLLKDRRLEDAEPDPQPDTDHDEAEPERDAPSPAQELRPRQPAERQDRKIGEEETGWPANLRPRRNQPAILV